MYKPTIICYILLTIAEDIVSIMQYLLWMAPSILVWNQAIGGICIIFEFVECLSGHNLALYINNNHILYYHMDTVMSTMFGHNYFISTD